MALAEYLQCGICFEPYTAGSRVPKFLQCAGGIQHTYCLECLRRLTVDGRIRCPCCGDMTQLAARGTADALMNNIYLLPQIEAAQAAAAAARTKNGLEMFCKTCTSMASDKCGEHELLKMSELRDALRQLAQRGAESMETVRRRRAELVALFREAYAVLVSVSESVRHTIEDYEMDVQLDDNIVSELERKREAAEALPADQLVDSYRLTEQHATDAAAALRETDTLEAQCRALLAASVTLSAGGANGSGEAFPVGEWLRSGDLMQALLAASVVVYSLDHVTGADEQAAAGEDDCHKPGAESAPPAAAATAAAPVQNGPNAKTTEKCGNGDVGNSKSKPSAKSTPSVNGKASEKSSKSTTAATTKTTVSASAAKVSSSQSASAAKVSSSQSASAAKVSSSQSAPASKGTTPAKASDAGKSAKPSASAPKDKSASATVTSTRVTVVSVTKAAAAPAAATTTKSSTTKQADSTTTNSADAAARSAFQAAVAAAAVPPSKPKPAPSFSSMVKSLASGDIIQKTATNIGVSTGRDGRAQQSITIPKEHHRFVLGRGGQRLRDLETQTATKIQVPGQADPSDKITVAGTKEGIKKAIHELQMISDEHSKRAYEKLEVPKKYHPFICGAHNENIARLQQENPGIRINIRPLSVMKDELTITGEKEGVMKAKQSILATYKEMERICTCVSVEVSKSQHKYLIGPRGNNIAEILQKTGVFVEMPPTDSTSDTITLRGPQHKLGQALTMVYDKANSVVMTEVNVPVWCHKYIIGEEGADIKTIMADIPKVHVEFDSRSSKVKIEGPKEDVEKARERITAKAKELEDSMCVEELDIPTKYHKRAGGTPAFPRGRGAALSPT